MGRRTPVTEAASADRSSGAGSVPSRRIPVAWLAAERAAVTFEEVNQGYTRPQARLEAQRGLERDLRASSVACPFHVDVSAMVRALAHDDFDGALETILRAHPWPGILGRTCKAYCETAEAPPSGVEPIALKELERAAATFGRGTAVLDRAPSTGRSVGIVGAGSAGAAVVLRLRTLGHDVVVYEQLPTVGGMMAVGYPEFRLPLDVVHREMAFDAWGVHVRCGERVDRDLLLRLRREHDAVVITAGQWRGEALDIPGADLEGVYDAIRFLREFRMEGLGRIPRRAIVVGGGYTAHDVARTLRRLGCDVRIAYRRGVEQLRVRPARRDQFLSVLESEGIPILFWTTVTHIIGSHGRVRAALCSSTRPGRPDALSQPTAVTVPGKTTTIECDLVVAAIGEQADLSFLPMDLRTEDGLIAVDDDHMTSVPAVFAVGEIATGPKGTTQAFVAGVSTAEAVDRYLAARRPTP